MDPNSNGGLKFTYDKWAAYCDGVNTADSTLHVAAFMLLPTTTASFTKTLLSKHLWQICYKMKNSCKDPE